MITKMKPETQLETRKIGKRRNLAFYVKACPNLSDRGFNMALEVYELNWKTRKLEKIGSDYSVQISMWKGLLPTGLDVIKLVYSDFRCTSYLMQDKRVVNYQEI